MQSSSAASASLPTRRMSRTTRTPHQQQKNTTGSGFRRRIAGPDATSSSTAEISASAAASDTAGVGGATRMNNCNSSHQLDRSHLFGAGSTSTFPSCTFRTFVRRRRKKGRVLTIISLLLLSSMFSDTTLTTVLPNRDVILPVLLVWNGVMTLSVVDNHKYHSLGALVPSYSSSSSAIRFVSLSFFATTAAATTRRRMMTYAMGYNYKHDEDDDDDEDPDEVDDDDDEEEYDEDEDDEEEEEEEDDYEEEYDEDEEEEEEEEDLEDYEMDEDGYMLTGTNKLWHMFDCYEIFGDDAPPRPVHTQETWQLLRQQYEQAVGKHQSTIVSTTPPSSPAQQQQHAKNGFRFPVEGRYVSGKGRGIFALVDIPANQLLYSTDKYTARFASGPEYVSFLQSIPRDLACDVVQWAYVQDIAINNQSNNNQNNDDDSSHNDSGVKHHHPHKPMLRISVDLDEGSFCNNGDVDEANMGFPEDDDDDEKGEDPPESSLTKTTGQLSEQRAQQCRQDRATVTKTKGVSSAGETSCTAAVAKGGVLVEEEEQRQRDLATSLSSSSNNNNNNKNVGVTHYWSLQDISAGDEIICSYSDFAILDGWDDFDL